MIDPMIRDKLNEQLDHLPAQLQQRVLHYAQSLAASFPAGVPGSHLLVFCGAIGSDDLQQMSDAIAEGCEQIDEANW